MKRSFNKEISSNFGTENGVVTFNSNNPRFMTRKTQLTLSAATTTESGTGTYKVFPRKNIIEQGLKTGALMMNSKHADIEWVVTYSACNFKNRYFKERVEAVCQEVLISEEWTKEKEKAMNLSSLAFPKQMKKKAVHLQIGNITFL